jgi:hypothetical protein
MLDAFASEAGKMQLPPEQLIHDSDSKFRGPFETALVTWASRLLSAITRRP